MANQHGQSAGTELPKSTIRIREESSNQDARTRGLSLSRERRRSIDSTEERKTVRFRVEHNVEVLRFGDDEEYLDEPQTARGPRRVFGGELGIGALGHYAAGGAGRAVGRLPAVHGLGPCGVQVCADSRASNRPGIQDLHMTSSQ